jgi:hypothetical protein
LKFSRSKAPLKPLFPLWPSLSHLPVDVKSSSRTFSHSYYTSIWTPPPIPRMRHECLPASTSTVPL